MNVKEGNKLIAEFMGAKEMTFREGVVGHSFWHTEDETKTFPNGSSNYTDYSKGYHSSWDWLMPVLKKINLLLTPQNYDEWRMISKPTEYDIERVHNQATEFIKWYNKNK